MLKDLEGHGHRCIVRKGDELTGAVTVDGTVAVPVGVSSRLGYEMDVTAPNGACVSLGFGLVEGVLSFDAIPCCSLAIVHAQYSRVLVHVPYLQQAENNNIFEVRICFILN